MVSLSLTKKWGRGVAHVRLPQTGNHNHKTTTTPDAEHL